jgi:hypothetical protein
MTKMGRLLSCALTSLQHPLLHDNPCSDCWISYEYSTRTCRMFAEQERMQLEAERCVQAVVCSGAAVAVT